MAETKKPLVFRDRDTKEKIPFYVKTEDVELPDGTDMGTKVAELEEAIGNAGDGTVTGVKVGSNTYEPTDGVVDISGAVPTSTSDLNNNSDFTTKAYVDAAVQAVQTALNNLMNGQNVTDAIDTFNEVKAFLEGIDTDDPTLFNQLKSLSDAITALQNTLGGKLGSSDIADNLTTNNSSKVLSAKMGKKLNDEKQDKLTVSDVLATINNTVLHYGDSVNIPGEKGDKGDKGDTVVIDPESLEQFAIINDLLTGGRNNALSAEMGKKLRNAVLSIFERLAPIAFDGEKPSLDTIGLSATRYAVVFTLPTGIQSSNTATGVYDGGSYDTVISADAGYRLETITVTHNGAQVQTTISNNRATIHIAEVIGPISIIVTASQIVTYSVTGTFDNCSISNLGNIPQGDPFSATITADENYSMTGGTVRITMGGTDVTSRVYNSSTRTISIAEVTGNVVINATAKAYPTITLSSRSSDVSLSGQQSCAPGGTWNGTLSAVGTGFALPSSISATMGGQSVTPTYDSTNGTISISNVTDDVVIEAIADVRQGYFKVYQNKTLNFAGGMVDNEGSCVTDYIDLGSSSNSLTLRYMFTSANGAYEKFCAMIYDSNKKIIYRDGSYEVKRTPSYISCNTDYERTYDLSSLRTAAGANQPLYGRFSFKSADGVVNTGCKVKFGSTILLDASESTQAVTSSSDVVHNVTYTYSHVVIDVRAPKNVVVNKLADNQPFEFSIKASSGYDVSNLALSITMGGVSLTSSDYTVTDRTISSVAYKIVRIENVTGDLDINASIS